MLSILIPTYNYNTFPLVSELYKQCTEIKNLNFEIIVNDDASEKNFDNDLILKLPHCFFFKQSSNKGLSNSRNFLIEKASFENCLFLDDDVWPSTENFILKYLSEIENNKTAGVIFGGIEYSKKRPKTNELLRWLYGKSHEALPYQKRVSKKSNHFLSSNVLIKKTVLNQFSYAKEISSYGYEDLIFNLKLVEHNISIIQTDNSVLHEKLDTSEIFLNKTENALNNLSKAIQLHLLKEDATGISKLEKKIKSIYLKKILTFIFESFKPLLKQILIGKYTNLKIYNFYRLGYFCSIHK